MVPPLAPADDKRRAHTFRSSMVRRGKAQRPRPDFLKSSADGELNNVKVTDFQSKEMQELTH